VRHERGARIDWFRCDGRVVHGHAAAGGRIYAAHFRQSIRRPHSTRGCNKCSRRSLRLANPHGRDLPSPPAHLKRCRASSRHFPSPSLAPLLGSCRTFKTKQNHCALLSMCRMRRNNLIKSPSPLRAGTQAAEPAKGITDAREPGASAAPSHPVPRGLGRGLSPRMRAAPERGRVCPDKG
jgi:hypothetical protein